ncbi:saccharopine dehydrogenase family protein [Paractinoplanes rhizophilus]|uniref:saccharopine dehydrogenase family protein n=1 Tax=Paractinoplanes rhizophilus TaxID=1416877 RepID=UPI00366B3BFD
MIVGGYGAVGSIAAVALAERGIHVTVAGRDLGRAQRLARRLPGLIHPQRVDIDQVDQIDRLLDGAAVVIMCVERHNEQVARSCLERGIHFVEVSATAEVLDGIERLDALAKRAGATAVLSVGLAPGLTNVLARQCVARLPSATSLDVTVLLGLSGDHGPDSVRWTMDNLAASRGGRGAQRKRVPLPGFGRRTAYPFPFADQHTLTRTLGIPVTTRVCFDSAAVTSVLFGLRAAGLFRIMDRLGATSALAAGSTRLRLGGDRFVVQATAVDGTGAAVTSAVTGRQECRATAVVAAQVAEQLVRQPSRPGVWHLDQVVDPNEFLHELGQHDLAVHHEI